MGIRIAVCDDNQYDINYLTTLIHSWGKNQSTNISLDTFLSGEEFLFHYEDNKNFDILILDIEMKQINGIQLAKMIRQDNNFIQIFFTTGYPEFISEGYEVAALHYLLKPIDQNKLFEVLNRAIINIEKAKQYILLSIGNKQKKVWLDSIIYLEVFSHSINITTTKEEFEIKMSMGHIIKKLSNDFIRCHRSFIVNIAYISSLNKTEMILDNNVKIPISRSMQKIVYDAFINYYKGDKNECI